MTNFEKISKRVTPHKTHAEALQYESFHEWPDHIPEIGEVGKAINTTGYFLIGARAKPKEKTSGGIILSDDSKEADEYLQQVCKIIHVGPACFKLLDFHKETPQQELPKVGDIVLFNHYAVPAGRRVDVAVPQEDGKAELRKFIMLRDADIVAIIRRPALLPFIHWYS